MAKRVKKEVKAKNTNKKTKLPGAFSLFKSAVWLLKQHWKVFLGILAIYGLMNAFIVQGLSAVGDLKEAKSVLDELVAGGWEQLAGSFTIFTYLLGPSGNSASSTAGVYQFLLILIVSLALIWVIRQLYAGNVVRVRDGFYHGMAPLVPFVLVLAVLTMQLLPMAAGLSLYSLVTSNGIAATLMEQTLWGLLAVSLSAVSLYFVSSSIFALYIVTLPDMEPMRALRSAKELVKHRRWAVLGKILLLPIILLLLAGLIMVPLILYATPLAAWAFYLIVALVLPIVHNYIYTLYRSLL